MALRVLVLAPRGRDAQVASELLDRHGIRSEVFAGLDGLVSRLQRDAGTVLVAEEALAAGDCTRLLAWVEAQPKWSDMPFIVLANGGKSARSPQASAKLEALGNVVLLERPLHADAIVGAVRSALKARRRQYEVRAFADTLERTVAERTHELEAARDSLQVALDAADMGSWDLDLATDTARRTARHDRIFGYEDMLPCWGWAQFMRHVVPEQREAVAGAFDAALATGGLDIECAIEPAGGGIRWIALKGRVHHGPEGLPVRMTGVVTDVMARRDTDARLAQAAKMDTIGQLTGGVAHDFNNLLTPIIGSLDMLRRRLPDDPRAEKLVGNALQAAERAATLTQRLLAFARRQTLQPRAVDVAALADGMVDLVRRSLGPSIEVVLDLPRHLPAASVDPNQLELALLNLAVNARDAMPDGGRLTIVAGEPTAEEIAASGLPPGRYVRIAVADTGTGMDAATLARAVEPFFSTKGIGKGTGLGLSMAHGLAAQSGGLLNLQSRVGQGTTVALLLPAAGEAQAVVVTPEAEPVAALSAATVLLVDDEELVRRGTADMLRDLGYIVVEATSGVQAMMLLRSGIEVDLLVTDYLMPGMSGAALIHEVRESGLDLPVLLVTGYANAGKDVPLDVPRLAKPFRQTDFAASLDWLLQSRHRTLSHS